MLEFKKIELSDIDIIRKYTEKYGSMSCENSFVTLLIWQCMYDNAYAVCDGQLIIKTGSGKNSVYRLPLGDNFKKGIGLVSEYSGEAYPKFWAQDGERFEVFKKIYGDKYEITEKRDAFDYIYLSSDLAMLSGKKYHSKRNHISAFSKKHSWDFKPITQDNIGQVRICAEKWYAENSGRADKYLECERRGLDTVLDNFTVLNAFGGAVYSDGMVVAFTIGSRINNEIVDIHFEKALSQYAEAYTVINNQFAKTLCDYKYINREDDMGIEGLRKAKLSYKPYILLKKYSCIKKVEQ